MAEYVGISMRAAQDKKRNVTCRTRTLVCVVVEVGVN